MTRLTNETREALLSDLLGHKFAPLLAPLVTEARDTARAIYESSFHPGELELAYSLPAGWLDNSYSMNVRIQGQLHSMRFDGVWLYHDTKKIGWGALVSLRSFAHRTPTDYRLTYEHKHKDYEVPTPALRERHTAARVAQEKLNSQFQVARGQVSAALAQFTTIEKLIDNWPEAEPFAKKFIIDPKATAKVQLPAIRPAELNAMLDLPVDDLPE